MNIGGILMKKSERSRNVTEVILFIIIAILIVIIIISCKVIQLEDKEKQNARLINEYKIELDNLKKQVNGEEGNISEEIITSEDYYISYSSLWMKPDEYTTLSLRSDGTFYMYINACEGVISIEGKYTKNNNILSLTDFNNDFSGFAGVGTTVLTFDIQNDGTLKNNNDIACMFKDSIFSRK